MYEAFFGLRERPFDLTTNPRFLFLTPRHREALSTLRYGLSAPRGLTLLLGDAGTGKTTVLRAALSEERRPENRHVLLTNPTLTRAEFYEFIARGFRLSEECAQSKARFLMEFQRDVQERHLAGGITTLIIDEAQSLPYELLEEVRLLANIETSTVKLLNLVLVGQPELADRLNEQSLRQLKQRITLRAQLGPLDLRETAAYIAGRLRIAGGNVSEIFTKDAVVAIYEISAGLPRIINVLSDNALMGGFGSQIKPVDATIVREVGRDFDFTANRPVPMGTGGGSAGHLPVAPGPSRDGEPDPFGDAGEREPEDVPRAARAVGGGEAPFGGEAPRKRRFLFF